MLVLLNKNRTLLVDTSEDDLYLMATEVADHKFPGGVSVERSSDAEVEAIAHWLKPRTRRLELGDKTTKFSDVRKQMTDLGCEFGSPDRNWVKIYRDTPEGRLSVRIGYPREGFSIGIKEIKHVRKVLKLDEQHGFDSGAFYGDLDAVVDGFVNLYRQVLERLALT